MILSRVPALPAADPGQTRILILLAHPYPQQSRVNRLLAARAASVEGVYVHDLYARYPDLYIDVGREQTLLRQASVIVFQHPMYWYSAPALLKEWQDLVLTRGFAVGRGGKALQGKKFLQVVTIGGSLHAYGREGGHRYTAEELLRPYEQMARLCGMEQQPPLLIYDAHHSSPDALQRHAERYAERLSELSLGISSPSAGG